MQSNDSGGSKKEEGCSGEQGAGDDVRLDRGLPAPVTKDSPDGRRDRVGAVFEPKKQPHVEGRQLEISENLKNSDGNKLAQYRVFTQILPAVLD